MCVNSEGFSARQNNLKFKTVYVLTKWADLGSFRIPRSVRRGCVMTTPLGKETSMLRCLLAKQSPGTCGFYYTGYWFENLHCAATKIYSCRAQRKAISCFFQCDWRYRRKHFSSHFHARTPAV